MAISSNSATFMKLPSDFSGRIFQLMDALDYGDAVSNQALALHELLSSIGVETRIYSKWTHEAVSHLRGELHELQPEDRDIVIIHFAGYSVQAWPYMAKLRCTRIVLFHNITPHEFFPKGSDLYEFCLKGREQLREVVDACHAYWGDSQYNVDEMIALGANPANTAVIPIVVPPIPTSTDASVERGAGHWLFVGRIAASKGHVQLINAFAALRKRAPEAAQKLTLVGRTDEKDPYLAQIHAAISLHGLEDQVELTGKVSDEEVHRAFQHASVYVSTSAHEGFGVPLIESAHRRLPVVALANSAITETMGDTPGLVDAPAALVDIVEKVLGSSSFRAEVLAGQQANAERFSAEAVGRQIEAALIKLLPKQRHFGTVSIVVCTYNRADLLERCLDYLQYQTNRNFEIVVVNGPSTDSTEQVIASYPQRIKVARNPERNLSKSRNIGIEQAAGDLIAFIDDDALPFDDWVETLLREFNSRPLTLAGLGGPAYFAGSLEWQSEDIGINRYAESRVNIPSADVGRDGWERSLLGTNTCFRADILRSEKGFDEQFDYFLDESELCYRLQQRRYIVGYCSDLYLRHEFAQSDNRGGKYKYNWYTICKNTAYFIAAYSGLQGKQLAQYLERRMNDERITPLKAAAKVGEIAPAELDGYIKAINGGVQQGLRDARAFPRTRQLQVSASRFVPFRDFASEPPQRPLHICIITKEFPPFTGSGGIGTLYYNLASEFLLMGNSVTVIAPGDKDLVHRRGRFVYKQTRVRRICEDSLGTPGFTNNLNWSTSAFHALAQLHATHVVDVVDSALWDTEALVTSMLPQGGRPPLVVRLVTPLPVAARLNGWSVPEYEFSLYCAAEKQLIEQADAVVPISQAIAQTIEKEHGVLRDERWVQSHCGIAYWPSFQAQLGYAELTAVNGKRLGLTVDSKLVLFVGRLEGRKGVGELLEAAAIFLEEDPRAQLVLAGRDIDNFEARATETLSPALRSRVIFTGQVNDATRDKLLHAAYCLVFPSRYESFGLVPLEAFVHSVPVVAARAGAIPEVVADGDCGLLFESGNAVDLARAVQRLLTESGLHERLSDGARKQIRQFSSRKSALRAVALYRQLGQRTVATPG